MLIGLDSATVNESRAIAQLLPYVRSKVPVISKSQKMPPQKEQAVVIFVLRQVHGATTGRRDAFAGPRREQG
jgi:hypothetical protein